MCLSTVTKIIKPKTFTGWKQFVSAKGTLRFPWQNLNGDRTVPLNCWLSTSSEMIGWDKKYPSGFHIYKSKNVPRRRRPYILKKVQYRNVVAEGAQAIWKNGRQRHYKVVVALEMFVPKEN